ncbi:MAG: NUDIX domain-containing protein [Micromonosporaceae bacterium]|nr:NUDIX domain-containing protein [Micromonosporaceae bacterium]
MWKKTRAAGGLLWRERDGVVEVALVHRPKHQDWSFPKGKPREGEHPLAAACREVTEETGARARVGVRLPSVTYQVLTSDGAAEKVVDYWAMRVESEVTFLPGTEVDDLRWEALDQVDHALTYQGDRDVAAAFAALPRDLGTVLLLQHAAAEPADAWDGPDVTRPLTAAGEADAARIASLLAGFGPIRAISATARRCVQTATSVADAIGAEVESDGVFDADSHARSPEVASERIRELAKGGESASAGAVVICCEDGVIPDTVALLADTDGLEVPTVATAKGAAWTLSFARGTLAAADYLPPDF